MSDGEGGARTAAEALAALEAASDAAASAASAARFSRGSKDRIDPQPASRGVAAASAGAQVPGSAGADRECAVAGLVRRASMAA